MELLNNIETALTEKNKCEVVFEETLFNSSQSILNSKAISILKKIYLNKENIRMVKPLVKDITAAHLHKYINIISKTKCSQSLWKEGRKGMIAYNQFLQTESKKTGENSFEVNYSNQNTSFNDHRIKRVFILCNFMPASKRSSHSAAIGDIINSVKKKGAEVIIIQSLLPRVGTQNQGFETLVKYRGLKEILNLQCSTKTDDVTIAEIYNDADNIYAMTLIQQINMLNNKLSSYSWTTHDSVITFGGILSCQYLERIAAISPAKKIFIAMTEFNPINSLLAESFDCIVQALPPEQAALFYLHNQNIKVKKEKLVKRKNRYSPFAWEIQTILDIDKTTSIVIDKLKTLEKCNLIITAGKKFLEKRCDSEFQDFLFGLG